MAAIGSSNFAIGATVWTLALGVSPGSAKIRRSVFRDPFHRLALCLSTNRFPDIELGTLSKVSRTPWCRRDQTHPLPTPAALCRGLGNSEHTKAGPLWPRLRRPTLSANSRNVFAIADHTHQSIVYEFRPAASAPAKWHTPVGRVAIANGHRRGYRCRWRRSGVTPRGFTKTMSTAGIRGANTSFLQ